MTPCIDIGVAKNCKNPDSYGEICVRCNKCGRFDKDHDHVSRGYLLSLANKDGAHGYISANEIINAPSLPLKPIECEDAVSKGEKNG